MTHYIDHSTAYKIDPLRDEDLRRAYERTAEYLTGKPVILRFQAIAGRDARGKPYQGECYFDENSIARINILPGISVQQSYIVLLHEAAHIRLNHPPKLSATQVKYMKEMSDLRDGAEEDRKPGVMEKEEEANRLADEWYKLGEDAIAKSLRLGTTEKQRALMNTNALLSCKWIGAK